MNKITEDIRLVQIGKFIYRGKFLKVLLEVMKTYGDLKIM